MVVVKPTISYLMIMSKVKVPLNTDADGCCMTIKTSYSRMTYANFLGHQHDGYVATAICEYESE